jgi:hypothetical protein
VAIAGAGCWKLREQVDSPARVRRHARGVFSVVARMPASLAGDTLLQCQNQLRDGAGLLPIHLPTGSD